MTAPISQADAAWIRQNLFALPPKVQLLFLILLIHHHHHAPGNEPR